MYQTACIQLRINNDYYAIELASATAAIMIKADHHWAGSLQRCICFYS
jgi:hypothetical protein